MKEVGFEGTLEEFMQSLKDDPQFYLDKKVRFRTRLNECSDRYTCMVENR
jgi:hypothetical protein